MSRRSIPPLALANLALLGAMALHGLDHAVQERGLGALDPGVVWGGLVLAVVALATLPLTLRSSRHAPAAAAFVGLWIATGVTASHLLPADWGTFSDAYDGQGLGPWSWIAVLAEIACALVFGLLGLRELRRGRSRPGAAAHSAASV